VSHLRLGGEGPHRDVAQMVGVADHHVDEEVVVACHMVERNNLGKLLGVLPETCHLSGLVTMETNSDHRLEANSDHRWVDIGVEATEDTGVLEPADSLGAGGLGDADPAGDLLVGQTRIVL